MYTIEIAVTDHPTACSAAEGGADRIELCSALSEGGITPSYSLTRQCRESLMVPLFPIIRPRRGDFLYTADEFTIMKNDVLQCKALGCDGVVSGALDADGNIDLKRTGILRELAYPMEFTFHRAFDRCNDPFRALEDLIALGCQRILTSGQQLVATAALPLIRQLVTAADGKIIIVPGSGIRPDNIKLVAEQTGATEFHASLRTKERSRMKFVHPSFAFTDDYELSAVDAAAVISLRKSLL